ncbi:MAG: hypothetical protein IPM35_33355 [Myxococcales bacterium]|nr:hypothetical protein [Myxococcales bacterium]
MLRFIRTVAVCSLPLLVACAASEDVGDEGVGGAASGGFGGTTSGGASGFGGAGATGGGGASGGSGGAPPSGGSGGVPSGGSGGVPSGGSGGVGGAGSGGVGATGGAGAGGGSGGGTSCAVVGCADGSESGAGCSAARVVGRPSAAKLGGFQVTANTCSAANDVSGYDATSCKDQGRDRSWRLYLKKFEKLDVLLTQGAKCSSATSWERVFKIYSGTSCTDQTCGKKHLCANTGAGTWGTSFVAPEDGWYVIVVDGKNGPGAGDDSGEFTLTLSLLCVFGGCEC